MKQCSKCKIEKSLDKFYLRSDKKGQGIQAHCIECTKKRAYAYKAKNEEKYKNYDLKKYAKKMTLSKYKELYKKQNGCCAICNTHNDNFKRSLAVDHNHKTEEIRGLLCIHCNQGLGKFKDSIILLQKAILYLINSDLEEQSKLS